MISIIVATSKNSVIGKNGQIPWYLPADLKHFASKTKGHTVIMGRRTYESIIKSLGHALPDRKNIIITNQKDFVAPDCIIVHSLDEALNETKNESAFICGGSEIYKLAIPHADKLFLTIVDTIVDGDTSFVFNKEDWKLVSEEAHEADEKNKYNYIFYEYERRK